MSEATGGSGQQPGGPRSIEQRALPPARQWRLAGFGVLAVGIVLAFAWFGGRWFGKPEAAPEAPASPPGTFRATAQQLKTLTIETVGERAFVSQELTEGKIAVNADRATPVYSPYSGRVTRVIAALGDTVAKDAPLATIEASEFVQGQSDLAGAAAQVKLAGINEARKHALYDAKGGSLQDWQQAQSDLRTAEATLSAARNRLRILGKSETEIDALENEPRINPAAAILAPIGGVVVDRQVGPGQYLQAGGPNPVFTIADASNLWLLANVREADAGKVRRGQSVEVRVLAYPDRVFRARLSYVAAVLDPVTHRLPVRADIDNRDGVLKPEMFANFRIITSDSAQAPAAPEAAVIYEGESAHVWVAGADGLLSYRAIRTGRSADGYVEVLDGLKPGEKIVTKGGLFIDQAATPAGS